MPPSPQNQPPQVSALSAGLAKIRTEWANFAGDLLEPMVILAAGGTKAQAAWAGMKGIFLSKVLGPLGMVVGLSTSFLFITRSLVKEWRAVGVQSAKAIETLTLQFKPLLGSIALAKQRAREIFAFSVKSPFKFEELAAGNKLLQSLTRGALAGKAGMELVGDAAAVAGEGFEEVSRYIGRLYDGLMSGRPVGEAAMRLQEMGLIAGQTRNQIEAMQAANADGSAIWKIVEKDIQRTKGAMDTLSQSLAGLQSTQEDTQRALEAGFGKGFLDGEKAAVQRTTLLMERMVPTATFLGDALGSVSNAWERFKLRVTEVITSLPGFNTVVTSAIVAVAGLASTITLAAGLMLGRFLLGVLSAAAANKQLARSANAATAATAVQLGVTGNLTAAKQALTAALGAVRAGSLATAVAQSRAAVASTVLAVRTNAVAAAQGILRGGLKLTLGALRMVTVQIVQMTVAMMATPIFWIAAACIAVGAALLHFHNKAKAAREALEELDEAGRTVVANLREQASAIRTIADLRKAEADAVVKLTDAHKALATAQQSGNKAAEAIARRDIKRIKEMQDKIRGMSGKTELSEGEVEREDFLKARAKDARKGAGDFRAGAGEDSALAVARERMAEGEKLMAEEKRMLEEEQRLRDAQDEARRNVEDHSSKEGALESREAELSKGIDARKDAEAASMSGNERANMEIELSFIREKLDAIRDLRAAEQDRVSKLAIEGDSELAALRERLKLNEDMVSAEKAVTDARKAHADSKTEEEKEGSAEKLKALKEAEKTRDFAKRLANRAGVGDWTPNERQNMQRRAAEIEASRNANLDPAAAEERRQAVITAELGLAQVRIDAESQVASLRLKGYEREKAMLDYEQQKLEAARRRGRVDDEAYARQRAALDAQKDAMEKAAGERRDELATALQVAALNRREDDARRKGDVEHADAVRAAADKVADEQAAKDARREGQDSQLGEGLDDFVKSRVDELRASREQERQREAEDQRLARDKVRTEQGTAAAAVRTRTEELQGHSKNAKRIREQAARAEDEIARREKQRSYRDQGFGAAEADAMANRDVKQSQAERLMDELTGRRGTVIADSLAAVGGGGNVFGSDPTVRLQERMVELLEDLNDSAKENVDMTMR